MKNLSRNKLRKIILEEIEVALDYEASRDFGGEGSTVKFSRDRDKDPIGLVPIQSSLEQGTKKNGLKTRLTVRSFLDFASDGGGVNEWIQKQIRNGRYVAPPWFDMVYVEDLNIWYVYSHEGRSRCKSIKDMSERSRVEVPVDLFLKKQKSPDDRAKDFYVKNLDNKAWKALENRVIKQEYTPIRSGNKEHYDLISSYFPVEIEK